MGITDEQIREMRALALRAGDACTGVLCDVALDTSTARQGARHPRGDRRVTHFVSASCEGNLCSVCKAPATHKLGEEIPSDTPIEPCPDCKQTWRDLSASAVAHKKWRRPCIHCGFAHPYDTDDDDREDCPSCGGELHPVSVKNCAHDLHGFWGNPRHNLTAYVCCAHFTMIVGEASGCPSVTSGVGQVAHKLLIMSECQMALFKDAVKVSERALKIHGHGAAHSQLAMVVFDLAEIVAAIARGDK